ncbi:MULTISPECIES: hypothetical protein [Oceanobacillus]|uniref:hypothetical protein n=1 Tax=Oceanobacillus TaxID=182709 RepID=UPI0030FC905A
MTIKLTYGDIRIINNFLVQSLNPKKEKSIHRMRVVKALEEKQKQVAEESNELMKEFAKLDDEGEVVYLDDGQPAIKDKRAFNKAQVALLEEDFVLDDKNLQSALNTVKKLVNDYGKELVGEDAIAHFTLVDAFENAEEQTKEEENDSDE